MDPYQGFSSLIAIIETAVSSALSTNPTPARGELFSATWKLVGNNLEAHQLLPNGNLFCDTQLTKNELLLLLIIQIIRRQGFDSYPIIHLSNKKIFEELGRLNGSATICGVHTGFAFLPSIMAQFNRKISIISSDESIRDTLTRSGPSGNIEVIPSDLFSFIRLRDSMTKGNLCVCSVDYSDGKKFRYISPSLFEFSIQNGFSIYFFKSEVNSDGSVSVDLLKSQHDKDLYKSAAEFIYYITLNQNPKRELSIKRITD
ncbi:hypothetical protein [Polynucleobacter sp. Tro8-14-1]|jgi:hypothetical protein|uniref:hypothetical protein n=1 Tax=Polynucleobacter sp. Tro8-14-1 TaxID=1758383 RepID=UPI001C0D0022|nr:hypothetical protein [Polynucleobacter sp. Tro8-14-1]MBU3563171.1 hypothetical protein [Polynucleobacter sp. Tro8-14-1]